MKSRFFVAGILIVGFDLEDRAYHEGRFVWKARIERKTSLKLAVSFH